MIRTHGIHQVPARTRRIEGLIAVLIHAVLKDLGTLDAQMATGMVLGDVAAGRSGQVDHAGQVELWDATGNSWKHLMPTAMVY